MNIDTFLAPAVAIASMAYAGLATVKTTAEFLAPAMTGYAAPLGAVQPGAAVPVTWTITRRTDCQATEARVWVGVKDFRLDEPVRPAVWPAAKKPITTVTMVLVPDVAPVGPLTMTVEGRYACPGHPPVDYRIGPVEMTVAAGK